MKMIHDIWIFAMHHTHVHFIIFNKQHILCMIKCVLLFFFPVVLIEWVQAAHLQGQDDPDHQVWN